MTRKTLSLLAAGLAGLAGCSPPPPPAAVEEPAVPVPVVAVQPPAEPKPVPRPPEPEKPKAEPFRYAADTGGKKVEQALAPTLPVEKPARVVTAPRGRGSEVESGNLPTKKASVSAAPLPVPPRSATVPPPPREGVPLTVGIGSEMPLRDAKLPDGPGAKAPPRPEPTAADVPRLAVQQPDKVPTDDPTADVSTQRIVNTLLLAPPIVAPFVRLLLPDPFEFAEQLKPPPVPELATTPVLVPPARP